MFAYEVHFVDGHIERISADAMWPNDWGAAFVRKETRPSKTKADATVDKFNTFRFISGRLIAEVREIA